MSSRPLVLFLLFAGVVPLASAASAPLASSETNTPGVSVDLLTVERKGNVLTIKWAARNEGSEQARVQYGLIGKQSTTYVVDEESGTKYYVLTDQEGNSLASEHEYIGSDTYGIDDYVPAGQTRRYWMKLPAPPPEVSELTVFVSDAAEPFESVTITEKQ